MDTMIIVSDCSRRGVEAAGRIASLVHECKMKPKTMGVIINRAPEGELNRGIQDAIKEQGLTLLGVVPHDEEVYNFDCDGKAIVNLPKDSLVKKALTDIIEKLDL